MQNYLLHLALRRIKLYNYDLWFNDKTSEIKKRRIAIIKKVIKKGIEGYKEN